MTSPKRSHWSEADVLALPAGEHDYFDRKSGVLLTSGDFRKDMAKALSALANSGGGHIVIGVEDDGSFTGLPPVRGRTRTREWLEQVLPNLVTFPLEDFRVHEVVPSAASAIPNGTVLLVVDVGDSVLAPHQSEPARIYYYREGGHSKPAPHFYLETLRNRLTAPTLEASLAAVEVREAYPWNDGSASVFVETRLKFLVKNTGRSAAYKWALIVEGNDGEPAGRGADIKFAFPEFPRGARGRSGGIRLDGTILPGLAMYEESDFGFFLRAAQHDRDGVLGDLKNLLSDNFVVRFRVVTETSRGETIRAQLSPLLDHERITDKLFPPTAK
ncbi:MAG TPA: ATP-binding protein [Caldimonas sp.]|jgi:hypothetical protein|nr:ATP-binding protein [Caldimonas sp.]HEX2541468.1 ATP-binding protein [Caldimonas sp.]